MKAVIQRVTSASVKIENQVISRINTGLLVFLGIAESDTDKDVEIMADKIPNLRVFSDGAGKMNLSLKDISGELLVVSQFTLLADLEKGRRPSFIEAARPQKAEKLYDKVIERLKNGGIRVETGKFQESMQVELVNNGPVTLIFDTAKKI